MAVARAVWLGTAAIRANERLVGGVALVVGAMLASSNHLHEFFHDGRHLAGVPCH
jgi:hypothetical protein